METLLKPKEAAALCRLSVRTLNDLAKDGRVPCVMFGQRGRRFSVEALEKFVRRQTDRQLVGEGATE